MINIIVTENTDKTLKLVSDNYILGSYGDKGFTKFTIVIPSEYLDVDLSTLKAYLVYKLQNGRYNNLYMGDGVVDGDTITYEAFELLEQNSESYPALFSQAGKVEMALSFENLDGTKYKSTLPNKQFTNKEAIGLDGQLASQNPATIKELQLTKMDKVTDGTLDHIVILDENGNAKDGGQTISEIISGDVSGLVAAEALIRQNADETLQGNIDDVASDLSTHESNTETAHGINNKVAKVTGKSLIDDTEIARLATDLSGTATGENTGDQDLSGLVPNTRKVNGKGLNSDITLSASDVGAITQTDIENQKDEAGGLCSWNEFYKRAYGYKNVSSVGYTATFDDNVIVFRGSGAVTLPKIIESKNGASITVINTSASLIDIESESAVVFYIQLKSGFGCTYVADYENDFWYSKDTFFVDSDGIKEGSENLFNRQADWNQSTNTAPDYIKNKPTLFSPTINTPTLDQVIRYNGAEWVNGEAVTSSASNGIPMASALVDGKMSKEDFSKLATVAPYANNYTDGEAVIAALGLVNQPNGIAGLDDNRLLSRSVLPSNIIRNYTVGATPVSEIEFTDLDLSSMVSSYEVVFDVGVQNTSNYLVFKFNSSDTVVYDAVFYDFLGSAIIKSQYTYNYFSPMADPFITTSKGVGHIKLTKIRDKIFLEANYYNYNSEELVGSYSSIGYISAENITSIKASWLAGGGNFETGSQVYIREVK